MYSSLQSMGSMATFDSFTQDYRCYISLIELVHPFLEASFGGLGTPTSILVRTSLGARTTKSFFGNSSTVPDLRKANSAGARGTKSLKNFNGDDY